MTTIHTQRAADAHEHIDDTPRVRIVGGHRPVVLSLTRDQARILWHYAHSTPDARAQQDIKALLRYVLPVVA